MKKALKAVLLLILTLALMATFCVTVILGDPDAEDSLVPADTASVQPLLPADGDTLVISDTADLPRLLNQFPAPALCTFSDTLTLREGTCESVPFEDGFAQVLTLFFETRAGVSLTLTSIYPARALALVDKGDLVLSSSPVLGFAGHRAVRMDSDENLCLFTQGEEAIYVLRAPQMSDANLNALKILLRLQEGG